MIHTIKEYDDRIASLEKERDRLLAYLADTKICLNTANRLDLADLQRALNAAISMCRLALRNEDP